jgi:hypothetical protein
MQSIGIPLLPLHTITSSFIVTFHFRFIISSNSTATTSIFGDSHLSFENFISNQHSLITHVRIYILDSGENQEALTCQGGTRS